MKDHRHGDRDADQATEAVDDAPTGATAARLAMLRRQRARRDGTTTDAVQLKAEGTPTTDRTKEEAGAGVAGPGARLPHLERIQRAFGSHDVSGVQAHVGGAAAQSAKSIGAAAYATGDKVAFREAPDLRTAAHEAAHVVQQRHGAVPSGGVGRTGDAHERHADAIADRVVAGGSAEELFQDLPRSPASQGVQRLDGKDEDVLAMSNKEFFDFIGRIAKGGKPSDKERAGVQKRLDALSALELMDLLKAADDNRLLMAALRETHGTPDGQTDQAIKEVPIVCFRFWNAPDRIDADVDHANKIYAEAGTRLVVVTRKVITKEEVQKVLPKSKPESFVYRADETNEGVVKPTHEDTNTIAAAFGLGSMLTVLYTERVCDYDFEEGLLDKSGVSNPIFCLSNYPRVVAVSSKYAASDTLAHELGHMLVDTGHRDEKSGKGQSKNLMAGGLARDKETLDPGRFNKEEIVRIQQSIFGWVVKQGGSGSSSMVKDDRKSKDEIKEKPKSKDDV
jgi:hypothetical protein